ncbi:MAG: Rpn family recombination-promoting nuclease/putative transposase [Prevotellaceae bacterium]|jgi:hypothetical protein|nr:Rpn family recombination-promoting nuclease/putative transposase [Prevotellaceae bacterium]
MFKVKRQNKTSKYSENSIFINPETYFGVKKIFRNKTIFISFPNPILSEKIEGLEYRPVEHFGYKKENCKAAYDISGKTTDGKYVTVEMQAAPQPHYAERELFYAGFPIIDHDTRGKITKTNKKNTVKYGDVILAVEYAEKRGEKSGFEIGEKRVIEEERNRLVRSFFVHNMSIENIAELMSITVKQVLACLKFNTELKN